jgi:CheY-like chemotaxis protein
MDNLTKKKVALIEDDPGNRRAIKQIFESYSEIELVEAVDAGEAMKILFPALPENRPDAVILDLIMLYGTAAEQLNAKSDPNCVETGVKLLRFLRESEKRCSFDLLWIAVTTERSNPQLIRELEQLLEKRGCIYTKPFDTFKLEDNLAQVLGIKSQVDPILLSHEHLSPVQKDGGR